MPTDVPQRPLVQRLFWFVALWSAGVAAVTLAGLAIRSMLG
jgi:hypothetical protein